MVDERAQAISFAEYYFALVDGIFPSFESHLAKNVVLDWFGRKIKGKKNVTAFIESDQTSTLHIFTDITPIPGIVCKKKQRIRKQRVKLDHISDIEKEKLEIDTSKQKTNGKWKIYKNAVKCLDEVEVIDYTVRENNSVDVEADDREVHKNDPSDDLEPEITSVDEEIQRNINESKLEEEMASTVKAIKRECGQGDRTVRAQTGTMKYIEANGQVKFTRKVLQKDPWSYHWTSLKINYWIQNCKLQIAYSRRNVNKRPRVPCMLEHVPLTRTYQKSNNDTEMQCDMSVQSQKKPQTLEKIIGISNELIPDANNFGGYLKPLNYAKDRDDFLRYFESTMPQKNLLTLHYVGNKLTFKYKDNVRRENFIRKFSYGNYEIHRIIYKEAETDENYTKLVTTERNKKWNK